VEQENPHNNSTTYQNILKILWNQNIPTTIPQQTRTYSRYCGTRKSIQQFHNIPEHTQDTVEPENPYKNSRTYLRYCGTRTSTQQLHNIPEHTQDTVEPENLDNNSTTYQNILKILWNQKIHTTTPQHTRTYSRYCGTRKSKQQFHNIPEHT